MNFEGISQLTVGVSGFVERVAGTPLKETDWTDMARALSNCTREQGNLLRSIYLHDAKATLKVVEQLAAKTCRIEHAGKLSRDLAFTVLRAYAAMRPCEHCEGLGRVRLPASMLLDIETGEWTPQKGGWKGCTWCKEDGFTHVRADEVRKMMGVSETVWAILLAQPFSEAYEMLRKWHKDAKNIIALTF